MGEIHPAPDQFTDQQILADPVLHYFHFAHLPPQLQDISRRFYALAGYIAGNLPRNPERTVALRKLLEAKDAAVRANVPVREETFADRLLVEHAQLSDRVDKLNKFIQTDDFHKLDDDQAQLLGYQLAHMGQYLGALEERMRLLGITVPNYTDARKLQDYWADKAVSDGLKLDRDDLPKGEILEDEDGDTVEVRTTRHADEKPIPFDD